MKSEEKNNVDLSSVVLVEMERNGRKYAFSMPMGAPFGEAYDAAFDVLEKIKEMSADALERARRQEDKKEDAPKSE